MGLLDDLKKEAQVVRLAQSVPAHTGTTRVDELSATAIPALRRIYRCLQELVDHLKVLQRDVPLAFKIPGVGDMSGFVQENHEVSADPSAPTVVTFRCTLRYIKRAPLEVKNVGSITQWVDASRRQGLQVKVLRASDPNAAQQRATVSVEAPIYSTLQFQLDPEAGALQLFSRNFDELLERRQFFNPTQVTDDWNEELVKFVMRQPHRFLVHEVASDIREYLRRRLEWEKLKRDAEPLPQESRLGSSARLKKLFKRAVTVTLRYAEHETEVHFSTGPFTLGRVPECDLVVREQRVSRFHARLEARDAQVILVDDSTNGTQVRFADGRVERLLRSSCVLAGSGWIALGSEPLAENPHAIHFTV